MAEKIDISIQTDIKQLRDELAKMPGIGGREAKKLVKALETEYKRAERAASRAAKRSADAWADQLDNMKGVGERTASIMGGVFGDLGDIVFDLTERFGRAGGAIGGMGGALVTVGGAATAGAGALALVLTGLREVADSAVEAAARLEETGDLYGVPPESLTQLRDYEVASQDLRVALDELQVVVGGELAEDMAVLARSLTSIIEAAQGAADAGETVAGVFRSVSRVVSLGLIDAVYSYTDAQYEAIDAEVEHERSLQDQQDMYAALGMTVDETTDAEARRREELARTRDAQRAAAEAAREYNAALREGAAEISERYQLEQDLIERAQASNEGLAALISSTTVDQLTEEDKIQQAYEARIARIEELAGTASDTGAIIEARQEAELRRERDLLTLQQQRAEQEETTGEVAAEVGEVQLGFWERLKLAQEEWLEAPIEEKLLSIADTASMAYGAIGSLLSQLHQNTIDAAEAEAERLQEQHDRWYEVQQAKLDGQIESGQLSEKEAILERRRIEDERKARQAAVDARIDAEEDAALKAFKAQKRIQIGQATIDSFRAGVALIPAYAYLGPGAPAAAAATAGVALAAAVAGIQAQEPPSFEVGGLVADRMGAGTKPDHLLIAARPDEGVLTGRGVQAAGGREGVDRLNRGQSGAQVVNLIVDGRTVATSVVDHLGDTVLQPTPGSFAAGRRPLYGR